LVFHNSRQSLSAQTCLSKGNGFELQEEQSMTSKVPAPDCRREYDSSGTT